MLHPVSLGFPMGDPSGSPESKMAAHRAECPEHRAGWKKVDREPGKASSVWHARKYDLGRAQEEEFLDSSSRKRTLFLSS